MYSNRVGNTLKSTFHFESGRLSDPDNSPALIRMGTSSVVVLDRGRDPGLDRDAILQEKVSQVASPNIHPITIEH